jgi:enoyl-CoA hydratase
MKTPGDIHIDITDGIATLRLANPARRNAMSSAMWHKLGAFAAEMQSRKDVRVVIIRGDGEQMFSAGADISDFATARSGEGQARAYDDLVENTCQAIEAVPQPTIGLIFGGAMGAGASVSASCDLRVAAEDAFFAVPAAKLGLGYDPRGIVRFIRVFGAGATKQVLFTADRLPATRAYALGAVHLVAPASDLEAKAIALARQIAGNAPLTIKAAKAAIAAIASGNSDLLGQAEAFYAAADASTDYAEGRKAFAEKRPPVFAGR